MEHKGITYQVLQTINPNGWKWVVRFSATKTKTGFSYSKDLAIFSAVKAIEDFIKETRRTR